MAEATQHVPTKEKIGYAMGDIATNFFFQSMILYQTRFYTDTAGTFRERGQLYVSGPPTGRRRG